MIFPRVTLRQIFRFTAWAAVLSTILGFAAQGKDWALALSIAFLLAGMVRLIVSLQYLCFHAIGARLISQKNTIEGAKKE